MIARNKAIDRLRADTGSRNALADRIRGRRQRPGAITAHAAESGHRRARLDGCLEQLDSRRRTLIRTAFFEGVTYEELARARHAAGHGQELDPPRPAATAGVPRTMNTPHDHLDRWIRTAGRRRARRRIRAWRARCDERRACRRASRASRRSRAQVDGWEQHFAGCWTKSSRCPCPAHVWPRMRTRLGWSPVEGARRGVWQNIGFWRARDGGRVRRRRRARGRCS